MVTKPGLTGYISMKATTKQVQCDSGMQGTSISLHENYDNSFSIFADYCQDLGIHERLGFASPVEAWKYNPVIQVSTIPSDFRIESVQIDGETYTVEPQDVDNALEYWDIFDSKGSCMNEGNPFYDNAPTFKDFKEILDSQ